MENEIKENKAIKSGKRSLFITTIVVITLSLIAIVGGIILFVNGIKVSGFGSKIWRIVLALALIFIGGIFGYASLMAFITSFSIANNKPQTEVKEETINLIKCNNCGHENLMSAEVCSNCKESLVDFVECECGTRNPKKTDICINCGKKLK